MKPFLLITSAFQLFHARSLERHQETYSSLKGDYAELWNASIFFMSVLPRRTWMPPEKLSWNIIPEYIPTICREKWINFTNLGAAISDSLRFGRSGDRSRWGRFSAPIQNGPGVHPVSFSMGTGPFQWVKGAGH